jgi:hypothetical protein
MGKGVEFSLGDLTFLGGMNFTLLGLSWIVTRLILTGWWTWGHVEAVPFLLAVRERSSQVYNTYNIYSHWYLRSVPTFVISQPSKHSNIYRQ